MHKNSLTVSIQGVGSEGGQVQKSRSNGALRRGRPLEKFGPELNYNIVESETLRETRRKYKVLYVSSLKSSDVSRQVLQVHVSLKKPIHFEFWLNGKLLKAIKKCQNLTFEEVNTANVYVKLRGD